MTATMIEHLLKRPCTLIQRAPGEGDEYGDPTTTTTLLETTCELQLSSSREEHDGAVQASTWRVWLPAGTPARGWDALELAAEPGVLYELDGDPWPAINPRTSVESHLEAVVRRTT